MAWRCSATSNADLIANLTRSRLLHSPRVVEAFKRVDRKYYVVDKGDAYLDSPSYIGHGATISAPHMHAHAVEYLEPFLKPGANVLDVGSGSGYLLPIFHSLVHSPPSPSASSTSSSHPSSPPSGRVLGIDHLPQLVALAQSNLAADPAAAPYLVQDGEGRKGIEVVLGDGRQGSAAGQTPEGGWDVIHVGAAAPTLPPALVAQLASPGRMFVPIGTDQQAVWLVEKDEKGEVRMKELFGVRYVPLTGREDQEGYGR